VNGLRTHRFESARDALLAVLAAAFLLCVVSVTLPAPASAPPRIYGAYTLRFGGAGAGQGKAVVTPKTVKIDATIIDEEGKSIVFSAPNLSIDKSSYRFRGTASLGGVAVTISGRIDPDDKTLKTCRVVATYLTADGKSGRIVGRKI
jgi:hypothetical protein